jgi:mono/diheme cytochrome c family protein
MKTNALPLLSLFLAFACCNPAVAANATDLFMDNCASCHGPDGKAHTPIAKKLGVKNLTESKLTLAQIESQITNGVKTAKGTVKMPAFDEKLGKEDISSVAAYVKALQN